MHDDTIDKRAATRQRVLKRGTLTFDGGGGIDCVVRSISSNGARLDIASPVGLPKSFTLVIETDKFIRRCRAVWKNEKQIRVAFD
ncbi:PilZ domain-containing protein [Bradyrhizobium sp.]|jgi:hypothetical protein|uniref:PilZ domain-containing protein n=1 Tax=Bradyrhizobium sp. TaxID=376 RepID=UPI003C1DF3C7